MNFQVKDKDTNETLHSTIQIISALDCKKRYEQDGRRIIVLKCNSMGLVIGVLK